jgi:hypothetical protein
MIHKVPSPCVGYVRIIFELPPFVWADHIVVVGDFNQWCRTATPLQQDRDGVWRATVDLPCGSRSEFRYLVDGAWLTDAHADGYAPTAYGSDNSVIIATLPEAHLTVARLGSSVQNGGYAPGYHRRLHQNQ